MDHNCCLSGGRLPGDWAEQNLFFQPTLSYIINPGSSSSIKNALPLTLRIGVLF